MLAVLSFFCKGSGQQAGCPTVCVTCVWAGVDSAWEQEKLEARKMLENAAESHTSGARGVGRVVVPDTLTAKDLPANMTKFYNQLCF